MVLRRIPAALRGVALVPIAVLAVHQLRFRLAFGGSSSHELAAQGHAYLGQLTPWIVLWAGFGAGALLGRIATARRGPAAAHSRPRSFLRLWAASMLVLLGIYAGQELLEGWFATGHPVGLTGVFGDGGWLAIPASLVVGLVLAAALHGTELLVARLGRRPLRRPHVATVVALTGPRALLRVPAPLAGCAAGRAPPLPG